MHPGSRARPDPTGHRVAFGLASLAAASALVTAFLAPATSAAPVDQVAAADPLPVQHVTRYVTLQPGETPPPNATVAQAPAATPRVVVVTTRQSGTKR